MLEAKIDGWTNLSNWFFSFHTSTHLLKSSGRFLWVSIVGLPPICWTIESLHSASAIAGDVILIHQSCCSGNSFNRGLVLLHSSSLENISNKARISVFGKDFPIMIREIDAFGLPFTLPSGPDLPGILSRCLCFSPEKPPSSSDDPDQEFKEGEVRSILSPASVEGASRSLSAQAVVSPVGSKFSGDSTVRVTTGDASDEAGARRSASSSTAFSPGDSKVSGDSSVSAGVTPGEASISTASFSSTDGHERGLGIGAAFMLGAEINDTNINCVIDPNHSQVYPFDNSNGPLLLVGSASTNGPNPSPLVEEDSQAKSDLSDSSSGTIDSNIPLAYVMKKSKGRLEKIRSRSRRRKRWRSQDPRVS